MVIPGPTAQIGSAAGALRREDVEADVSSLEAMGDPLGARADRFETESAEHRDVPLEGTASNSDIDDRVEVLGHAGRSRAVLQAQEENHLTADQRPGVGRRVVTEVDEGTPHSSEQLGAEGTAIIDRPAVEPGVRRQAS